MKPTMLVKHDSGNCKLGYAEAHPVRSKESLPVPSGAWSSSQGYGPSSSGGTAGFEADLSLRPAFLFTKLT